MSSGWTNVDLTDDIASDSFYDDMPPCIDSSSDDMPPCISSHSSDSSADCDDRFTSFNVRFRLGARKATVHLEVGRGKSRRKKRAEAKVEKKREAKTAKLSKDEKGLSKKMENLNLSEGGNSSSSAHPIHLCSQMEENQNCEKKKHEKEESQDPFDPTVSETAPVIHCAKDWDHWSSLPKKIYRTCLNCGQWNPGRSFCAEVLRTECKFIAADLGPIRSLMRMIKGDKNELICLSTIRDGEEITVLDCNAFGTECLTKCLSARPTWEHGVRWCPWDETSLFIPILSKETGTIVGYGKKKKILADGQSYSEKGFKEWFSVAELKAFYGRKMANRLIKKKYFETQTVNSQEEYEVTECMIALYLFPWPCLIPWGKPFGLGRIGRIRQTQLRLLLAAMRWDDIIDVYRS